MSEINNQIRVTLTEDEASFLVWLLQGHMCGRDDPEDMKEYEIEEGDLCCTIASKLGHPTTRIHISLEQAFANKPQGPLDFAQPGFWRKRRRPRREIRSGDYA